MSLKAARDNYERFGSINKSAISASLGCNNDPLAEFKRDLLPGEELSLSVLKMHFNTLVQKPLDEDIDTFYVRMKLMSLLGKQLDDISKRGAFKTPARELWRAYCMFSSHAFEDTAESSLTNACANIRGGNLNELEILVRYLECDPWYHGSGYQKEQILKALSRCKLNSSYVRRLQDVILNVVNQHDCREFRYYCKFARYIDDENFRTELDRLSFRGNPAVQRRANWMLEFLKKFGSMVR
jgi:hypothetical protein